MAVNQTELGKILAQCAAHHAQLVAVTKYRTEAEMRELHALGVHVFGENKVQEILRKQPLFPPNIEWQMIGHLQKNKVKSLLPCVGLIQSVDSTELLQTIDREANKINKTQKILLQVHIAAEEHKYGFSKAEIVDFLGDFQAQNFPNIEILGLMGMASLTEDAGQIADEFSILEAMYNQFKSQHHFHILSMGMSSDYEIALAHGATLVRIGSKLFF